MIVWPTWTVPELTAETVSVVRQLNRRGRIERKGVHVVKVDDRDMLGARLIEGAVAKHVTRDSAALGLHVPEGGTHQIVELQERRRAVGLQVGEVVAATLRAQDSAPALSGKGRAYIFAIEEEIPHVAGLPGGLDLEQEVAAVRHGHQVSKLAAGAMEIDDGIGHRDRGTRGAAQLVEAGAELDRAAKRPPGSPVRYRYGDRPWRPTIRDRWSQGSRRSRPRPPLKIRCCGLAIGTVSKLSFALTAIESTAPGDIAS